MRQSLAVGKALNTRVLIAFMDKIAHKEIGPFFDRSEIDELMTKEVFEVGSLRRYADLNELATVHYWNGLLNCAISPIISYLSLSKADIEQSDVLDIQKCYRRLKQIEDWAHFHPEVQQAIREALAKENLAQGCRLKLEFLRAGRPEIIRKALFVDDNHNVMSKLTSGSRELNFEKISVDPSGAKSIKDQVLAIVAAGDIDLIVMDGKMPGARGDAIIRELRETGYQGIIFANSDNLIEEDNMLLAGADLFIPEKDIFKFSAFFVSQIKS